MRDSLHRGTASKVKKGIVCIALSSLLTMSFAQPNCVLASTSPAWLDSGLSLVNEEKRSKLEIVKPPANPATAEKTIGTITGNLVNVREGTSTNHTIISQVPKGTIIDVVKQEKGWVQVKLSDGRIGWVADWLISISSAPAQAGQMPRTPAISPSNSNQSNQKVGIITGNLVNIRSGPSESHSIINQVPLGTRLPIVKKENGWVQIGQEDGKTGWVAEWLIVDEAPIPEQPDAKVTPIINLPSSSQDASGFILVDVQPEAAGKKVTIQGETINLRQGPSTDYEVIATVNRGAVYSLRAVYDGWYLLEQQGKPFGWIASWHTIVPPAAASSSQNAALKNKKIVVDPGHGYYNTSKNMLDQGASSPNGLKEKDVVLDIAKRLEAKLKAVGAVPIMTRTADGQIQAPEVGQELRYRTNLANNSKADIFVSIHANAHPNAEIGGSMTFFYGSEDFIGQSGTRQRLAHMIQQEMVNGLGRRDAGVRETGFVVLRESAMPSVLVETMFISNPEEEQMLAQPAMREKMADAIFLGIKRYFEQP